MKCKKCGRVMTIHIARSGLEGFWNVDYCERCGDYQTSDNHDSCMCGKSFGEFIETGLLGCEKCYDAFSDRLNSLLVQYRGRATAELPDSGLSFTPGRMAQVRTAEIRDMLKLKLAKPGENKKIPLEIRCPEISDSELEEKIMSHSDEFLMSMRIRLARNIDSIPYPGRLDNQMRENLSRILLSEKNILNQWMLRQNENRTSACEVFRKVYSNDEDHLRIQWIFTGKGFFSNDIADIMSTILKEIHEIDGFYIWQFNEKYGYLTACPGNSGTGLRISFKLNVRGLKKSGNWPRWRKTLKDAGLVIRGHRGEGSPETEFVEISSSNTWNFNLEAEFMRTVALIERIQLAEKSSRMGK